MRSAGPIGLDEFERALTAAIDGGILTDQGAGDRLNDALVDIAIRGATPEREAEARAAFDALRRN